MFGVRVKSDASRRLLTRVRRPGQKRLVVHARFARLAQEAEAGRGSRSRLIKLPDRISERPPQLAVFLFG